jgi:LppM domain
LKKIKIFLLIGFLLLLSGCINYEEQIELNADGSGKMIMHYSIPQQLNAMMQLGQGQQQDKKDEMPFKFKESEIRSDLNAPGVTVDKFETKAEGDQQHYYVYLSFKKITDLNETKSFKQMRFAWNESDKQVTFQQVLEGEKNKQDSNPMGDQMASAVLGNAKFKFKVKLPGKALPAPDTNGTIQEDGKTVSWEFPLLEASKGQVMIAKFEKGGLNLPFGLPIIAAIAGGVLISIVALVIVISAARKM